MKKAYYIVAKARLARGRPLDAITSLMHAEFGTEMKDVQELEREIRLRMTDPKRLAAGKHFPSSSIPLEQRETGAAIMVRELMKAFEQDIYPLEVIESMFGIQFGDGKDHSQSIFPPSYSGIPIGNIVYLVWNAMWKAGLIDNAKLEAAIVSNAVPTYFFALAKQFASTEVGENNMYLHSLAERVDAVVWEPPFKV